MKNIYVSLSSDETPLQQVWADDPPDGEWLLLVELYPNGTDAPNIGLASAVANYDTGTLTRTFDTVAVTLSEPPNFEAVELLEAEMKAQIKLVVDTERAMVLAERAMALENETAMAVRSAWAALTPAEQKIKMGM